MPRLSTLQAGSTVSWIGNGDRPVVDLGFPGTAGNSNDRLLQLMFEGVKGGSGTLHFDVMKDEQVLGSSSVHLRLRPTKELYDHYSVAYGDNVTGPGTFRDDIGFNPLDIAAPVPTTAQLVSGRSSRAPSPIG